ncbi:MAG: hypothetical protein RIQ56_525 [Candidatus Parcubacteria bacterium]|jgi:UPF0755 protein
MDFLRRALVKFFRVSERMQLRMSNSWRTEVNRRTLIVLLLFGSFAIFGYLGYVQAPDRFPLNELVEVKGGESLRAISQSLHEQGVVQSPLVFELLVKLYGRERGARAGDYLFKEPKNVWEVAKIISIGAYGLEPLRIRIHEGATTREMGHIFSTRLKRFNEKAFLEAAQPQEGFLFPDTYFFLPNATESQVLLAMRQAFDEKITDLQPLIASSTMNLKEIITLASIIEREARNSADRRMISGVLWNRLKKKMPLQVDVTFLYTIGKNSFQLTYADLKSESPYNTYVHKGLPPGPIGSPSIDSIQAALQPTKNDYLFYLADFSGVTHFSKTYEEHRAKKLQYLGT